MAARYLLDTNICIYIRREHPLQVLKRFERLKPLFWIMAKSQLVPMSFYVKYCSKNEI